MRISPKTGGARTKIKRTSSQERKGASGEKSSMSEGSHMWSASRRSTMVMKKEKTSKRGRGTLLKEGNCNCSQK